jgi:hypothetical protein
LARPGEGQRHIGSRGRGLSTPLDRQPLDGEEDREDAFYHSNGEKKAPLSDKEFTERPTMFVVRQLQREGTKGLLVLVVEGHSPEQIEEQVLAHLQQPAGEIGLIMAFGRRYEGVKVFK